MTALENDNRMHIYIIAQYLNLTGQAEDRLYKLGRDIIFKGHQVTVFTISSGTDFKLEGKMIGLAQKGGLPTIAFNVPYDRNMSNRKKVSAYLKFARLASKQGLTLPEPDLIIATSPPLTAVIPALKLSKRYQVPLVAEIRELWPDAPIQRGSLKNRLLVKAARRLEENVYEKAGRIIAGSPEIYSTVKERLSDKSKITVMPAQTNEKEIIKTYERAINDLIRG
jgi:hypothetical protein